MFYICVILLLGIIFFGKLYLNKKLKEANDKYFYEYNKKQIDDKVEYFKNNSYYSLYRENLKQIYPDNLEEELEKGRNKIVNDLINHCITETLKYQKKYEDLKWEYDSLTDKLDNAKIELLNKHRHIENLEGGKNG